MSVTMAGNAGFVILRGGKVIVLMSVFLSFASWVRALVNRNEGKIGTPEVEVNFGVEY